METVPSVPAGRTTYEALYRGVSSYCSDLGITFDGLVFDDALEKLEEEQCLVYFDKNDVRPTTHGLLKFS